MKITTAGLLLPYLQEEGVEYIFGVPGTSLVPLYDAINKQDAIKPILTKEVLELAETLNIPVATIPKGKGAFPESHERSLDVLGFAGSPAAEEYIMGDVDVVLVIGASLDQMTTFSWEPKIMPSDCLIHIDIDPSQIGESYPADVGLVGDCRAVLGEISFRILSELNARLDYL